MLSKLLFSLLPRLRKKEKYAMENGSMLLKGEEYAMENGSMLLEDLIASCDGKSNPIRHYSAEELIKATNNFHHSCRLNSTYYGSYKCVLDNRLVMIKAEKLPGDGRNEAIRDIIISMQMSSHKNVLKLLGCCLEFPVPVLVLEYAAKGVLNCDGSYGDNNESLPWKTRLRIAKQVANAVTYLHTAFPRPIIHTDLKPSRIFLDDDFTPKLSGFSHSVTIPPEQLHVEAAVRGSIGYLDPAYDRSGNATLKSDVYSFGVILLVFLTGRQSTHPNIHRETMVKSHDCPDGFRKTVDPKILEEFRGEDEQAKQQQLRDFLALALLCTQDQSESSPDMIDVAKELVRIDKSINPC